MLRTTLGRLRAVGIAEGISYLVLLLIAMPLKYLAGQPEAVLVVGSAHGALFVLYCLAVLHAWIDRKWPFSRAFLAGFVSVIPLGTFWFDAKLKAEERAAAEPAVSA